MQNCHISAGLFRDRGRGLQGWHWGGMIVKIAKYHRVQLKSRCSLASTWPAYKTMWCHTDSQAIRLLEFIQVCGSFSFSYHRVLTLQAWKHRFIHKGCQCTWQASIVPRWWWFPGKCIFFVFTSSCNNNDVAVTVHRDLLTLPTL